MGGDYRSILIYLFNFNLPVAALGVQGGGHFRLPKEVNTLIHSKYWARITFDEGVRLL